MRKQFKASVKKLLSFSLISYSAICFAALEMSFEGKTAKLDLISFHPEATKHVARTIDLIKSLGCKAGIALNPATSTSVLENIIQDIDLVLLMSVNPGFGGQKFIPSTLKKIQDVKAMIDLQDRDIYLEVDGGINLETIASVSKAGANVFVAGSAIFGSSDYEETIQSFRQKIS